MIIQSRNMPALRNSAAYASTDDEADDDPWSGYGDTLEMELNTGTPTTSSPETFATQEIQATSNPFLELAATTCPEFAQTDYAEPDEFAAAGARLQQRGDALTQRQLQHAARRPQQPQQYFPHLEQGYGYGLGGRAYAPTPHYTPAPRPVQYAPPTPVHQVPTVINIEANPLAAPEVEALPYEIDAYGNPILPPGMELDPWGNLIPRNDYDY